MVSRFHEKVTSKMLCSLTAMKAQSSTSLVASLCPALAATLADGQAEFGRAGVLVDSHQQRRAYRGEVVKVIDGEWTSRLPELVARLNIRLSAANTRIE
jgi:hypothetical protein